MRLGHGLAWLAGVIDPTEWPPRIRAIGGLNHNGR